jgi:hypothetical protein
MATAAILNFFQPPKVNLPKMVAVAIETTKMQKKKMKKTKNDHNRFLAEQKLMKLDKNNIHI